MLIDFLLCSAWLFKKKNSFLSCIFFSVHEGVHEGEVDSFLLLLYFALLCWSLAFVLLGVSGFGGLKRKVKGCGGGCIFILGWDGMEWSSRVMG
jgi:hypothetical protein